MFIIRIFAFIWGLIVNIIFDITREKLIDENKKYDFLINKFKHLVEEVPGRGPLAAIGIFKKEYYDLKVESIQVGLPKKTTEDWKVFAIMKKGDDYNNIEILSITDNNLEFSLFKKEVDMYLSKNKSEDLINTENK